MQRLFHPEALVVAILVGLAGFHLLTTNEDVQNGLARLLGHLQPTQTAVARDSAIRQESDREVVADSFAQLPHATTSSVDSPVDVSPLQIESLKVELLSPAGYTLCQPQRVVVYEVERPSSCATNRGRTEFYLH